MIILNQLDNSLSEWRFVCEYTYVGECEYEYLSDPGCVWERTSLPFFKKIAKGSGQLQRQIIALPCDLQQKHQTSSGSYTHEWKRIALLIIK